MTSNEVYIHEKAELEATIVRLKTVLEIYDTQNTQNAELLSMINSKLVEVNGFIKYYEIAVK